MSCAIEFLIKNRLLLCMFERLQGTISMDLMKYYCEGISNKTFNTASLNTKISTKIFYNQKLYLIDAPYVNKSISWIT